MNKFDNPHNRSVNNRPKGMDYVHLPKDLHKPLSSASQRDDFSFGLTTSTLLCLIFAGLVAVAVIFWFVKIFLEAVK